MRPRPWTVWLWLLLLAQLALTGCVSRRLMIRSNPPGALVEVDGERIGLSPVSTDFTYYGTREIKLSHPGYETTTIQQPINPPLYQRAPLDFFSNHFLPFRVTDRHDFTFALQPRYEPIDEEQNLINRARNIRSQAEVGNAP